MITPKGYIGNYSYYTPDDLENIIYNAQNHNTYEEIWRTIKIDMTNMAMLIRQYAGILNDYESRYIDDGR